MTLANMEMTRNIRKSKHKLFVKSKIIQPSESGLKHPIYIYNVKNDEKIKSPSKYYKEKIHTHIAEKFAKPFISVVNGIKHMKDSSAPIDTFYNSLGRTDKMFSNANPLSCEYDGTYRLLIHEDDAKNINTIFMSHKVIYLI